MKVKDINFLDLVNYKTPCVFIGTHTCSFKCDKECGRAVCQNSPLAALPTIDFDNKNILQTVADNPVVKAIVIGGLEPFDDFYDLMKFVQDSKAWQLKNVDLVIYTGYNESEIDRCKYRELYIHGHSFANIIIKFGRFIPDSEGRYDDLLGIRLASDNQYAKNIEEVLGIEV